MRFSFCSRLTMKHKLILLTLAILCAFVAFILHHTFLKVHWAPVVVTQQGKLQGKVLQSRLGNEYLAYLGIPYAKPPVESLRFQTPQDPESWEGIRDASYFRSACFQMEIFLTGEISGSEDCLFLNVYIPKGKKDLPVMAYMHGGLFHVGSSDAVSAEYFMDEDIVLVNLNYRLGALGFLNTGDGLVRGNMGLKDQSKALQWIQKNIAHFGGNPKQVTIFGESAGGAATHYHVLSPMSKGLFHRAISQSGTTINYWAMNRTPKKQAERIATKVNCPVESSKLMVECLRNIDASELVSVHAELLDVVHRPKIAAFVPTIEIVNDTEAFITEEPIELLESGRFNRVPWITGLDANEGLLISSIIGANQTKLNEANDDWDHWAASVMHFTQDNSASQKILTEYFKNDFPINTTKKLDNFTEMIGDRLFTVAASNAASWMSKYVPTYFYLNTYHGQFSLAEVMPLGDTSVNVYLKLGWLFFTRFIKEYILLQDMTYPGTCHGDELILLFPVKFLPKSQGLGQKDYQMSVDLVKLWTSFAKDSDTNNLTIHGIKWPQIDGNGENQTLLRLSASSSLISNPYDERVRFWNSLNLPLE